MVLRTRILAWLFALVMPIGSASAETLLVFAAASTKTALDNVVEAFEAKHVIGVTVSYASSAALARQIEQGAPVDIYLSANIGWMEYLEERGALSEPRFDLLTNRLVLIGNRDRGYKMSGDDFPDIAALLGKERLAMGLVSSVPAGIYGKAALENLGQWDAVAPLAAQADNVRAALALVATGAAPLGIVYATDVAAEPRVVHLADFPETSHPPILYPVALTARPRKLAIDFILFLRSDEARAIFESHGFMMVEN